VIAGFALGIRRGLKAWRYFIDDRSLVSGVSTRGVYPRNVLRGPLLGGVFVSEIFQGVVFDIVSGGTQTRRLQGSEDVIEFDSMRQRSIDFEV
jgi:hypothetical protein